MADGKPTICGDAYRREIKPRADTAGVTQQHGVEDLEQRNDAAAGHRAEHARLVTDSQERVGRAQRGNR